MVSEAVKIHIPCEYCGSSDGAALYSDGHKYCFVCNHYTPAKNCNNNYKNENEGGEKHLSTLDLIPFNEQEYSALRHRRLTLDTCEKYHYAISKDNHGDTIQVANYLKNGEVVFQKTRNKNKEFVMRGKREYRFFGQELFTGGRKLVITEGEIDCLTVSQVQGNKYPVVSVPFGVQSAEKTFKEQYDWLLNFDEVIVMFDMDKAGQEGLKKVEGILPPHKLKIAKLPFKDPNECLCHDRADDIIHAIWNATPYTPDGILNAKDLKDDFFSHEEIKSYSFPWTPELTKMTAGIRKGEMLLLTAGTGVGKSTAARELAYKLKMQDGMKIGMVMLEENKSKTLRDLLSIRVQKPLHLLWNTIDKTELLPIYDEVFGDGNFYLYDHFGSIESGNLLEKIRYLITGEGCDFIIFDHISIAISGLDESKGNERKAIDILMTQLRSLVEETGAGIVVVSHLRKGDNKTTPFEQGGVVSLDDLRGSGTLKQIPDTIIALERNQQEADETIKNTLKLRLLKCRFTGNTGLAGYVRWNKSLNILQDVDPLEITEAKEEESNCQF